MRQSLATVRQAIPVNVHADDPLTAAGLQGQLAAVGDLVGVDGPEGADVTVLAVDTLNDQALETVRRLQRSGRVRIVLVVARLDQHAVLAAAEAGVMGLLRRSDAAPDKLAQAVRAAAGGQGTLPPDLVGGLLTTLGQLQRNVLAPRGLHATGLSDREVEVLGLAADGFSTSEIATELAYSERTIKNILHDVTTRLNLRNRTHAVAYALREGLI